MSAAEDAREWAVCVQSDLTTIACVLRGERVPWDSACFHAQQAVGRYPTVAACPEGEEGLSVVRRARAIALDILSSLGIGLDDPLKDSV
jgi:hypothetical protein